MARLKGTLLNIYRSKNASSVCDAYAAFSYLLRNSFQDACNSFFFREIQRNLVKSKCELLFNIVRVFSNRSFTDRFANLLPTYHFADRSIDQSNFNISNWHVFGTILRSTSRHSRQMFIPNSIS